MRLGNIDTGRHVEDKTKLKQTAQRFYVHAIGDKTVTPQGIGYVLFWDYDGKALKNLAHGRPFPTRNGYHFIEEGIHGPSEKASWQWAMAEHYPSDYILSDWNWIHPHTNDELRFILEQFGPYPHRECVYYRDKAVFESYG